MPCVNNFGAEVLLRNIRVFFYEIKNCVSNNYAEKL